MTNQPQKPGEQLAMEALASAGLTFETLAAAAGNMPGAEKIHDAIERLCAMPATQQRSDALRAIVNAIEAGRMAGDPLPTPKFLIGDAWLEEFERLGENDLSSHVIVCILYRSSWDELHGPVA